MIPSVTTILGVFRKPALERWKMRGIAEAAFENPPKDKETREDFISRCLTEQSKPSKEAADFGTKIHDAIEDHLNGKKISTVHMEYIKPAIEWKKEKQLDFLERETTLVNPKQGFAGRVDIVSRGPQGQMGIVDWKTKKTKEGEKIHPYDFQIHQIAAYGATYWGEEAMESGQVFGANCFISSTEVGRFEVISYKPTDLARAWEVFKMACAIWRSIKNHDPRD